VVREDRYRFASLILVLREKHLTQIFESVFNPVATEIREAEVKNAIADGARMVAQTFE
jgi:hypothetical protein